MKSKFIFSFVILSITVKAQWQLGGNNAPPLTAANSFIGSNATSNIALKIGVQGSQDIFIDNNPAQLYTGSAASGAFNQGGHWIGLGRVFTPQLGPGAFPIFAPKAHLHIHGNNTTGSFGFTGGIRNWFNTGVLMTENSDGMYVGLRSLAPNTSYAVVNWSDDAFGGAGTDFLSFNFTGGPSVLGSSVNGMELGRFNPTPNSGSFGVGNFQFINAFAEPTRRVEILDAEPNTGLNANRPQLRLTYAYNANPVNGIFSEFQTTNLGDLYFNARSNSNLRRFGFHTNTPNNTVEIDAFGSSPIPLFPSGSSGLRFTRLTAANTPQANPGNGVLTVNASGDIIYAIPQFGYPCSNPLGVFFTGFTQDRSVFNGNFNFWFSSLNNQSGGVGVGGQPASTPFCNVGNTFEVSANLKGKYGNTNASGVRLTKLTSASPIIANGVNGVNSTKLLTVDSDGDIVLTNAVSSLGNICGAVQNSITANYEIPINNNNFIFSRNALNTGNVGIGNLAVACVPGNLLEVRKGPVSNVSGLRLTDLAGAVPLPFNNQVLSVNPANGDVILTNAPTSTGVNLGGVCGSGLNPLTNNWELPLNNNNFIFGGQGLVNNNVGIGTTCAPIAKLDVLQNSGNFGSIGINIENQDVAGSTPGVTDVIGIKSLMSNPAPGCSQIAGWFEAVAAGGCVGAPQAHAIYVPQNGGGISIGFPNPALVGFGSLLDVNGTISAAGVTYPSDVTLKNSVTNIANSLTTIKKLRPVTYNWNTPLSQDMNGLHAGFIAQEVDTVLPHLVKTNPASGKKSVAYTELIPYLVKAIQQLEKQNQTQDSLITILTGSVNSCCSNSTVRLTGISGGTITQQNVNLSDVDVIVLNQNTPNPFAEQTTITYNVPAKYKFAQIIFKTIEGKIIRTVDVTTKGQGQLNVFANDLSAGLYLYTLIVDGQIIDSKKMVKE